MQKELNTPLLGLSEKQLKERCTKMDTAKIAHAYNQMATSAQELFTTSFDFKKVDCEYLELTIEENLLEVRILCVYFYRNMGREQPFCGLSWFKYQDKLWCGETINRKHPTKPDILRAKGEQTV